MKKTDNTFKEFISDQLGAISDFRIRAMFGGYGLYSGKIFFGLIAEGKLYLKTTDETRKKYIAAGMSVFAPYGEVQLSAYYEVPVDVLEDDAELTSYAREAIDNAASPSTR